MVLLCQCSNREENKMFNPVRMQLKLSAPPERVFQALTDARALEAWFCEHAEVTKEHYAFWGRFTPEAPDREAGQHPIVSRLEGRELVYDWRLREASTKVTMKLLPQDGGTILTVRQIAEGVTGEKFYHLEDFWFLALENLRRYLDGKPSDARVDYTHPMRGDIHHETLIDASPERVFEVLLRPEELERWIATRATVEPKIGGTYDIGWGDSSAGVKIVDLVDNEKLSIALPEDPTYGNKNRKETIITWTLEGSEGKTRLTFVHSGFDADEDVSGLYTGWRSFLNWVRSVAEYGQAWQPPIVVLAPDSVAYPRSIHEAQPELVAELKASLGV
jgi:uncharacterized protein YndB with AHSA1/START domain